MFMLHRESTIIATVRNRMAVVWPQLQQQQVLRSSESQILVETSAGFVDWCIVITQMIPNATKISP